jgi:anti-sigma regulatory factor (Ser/Thr protein kinase)
VLNGDLRVTVIDEGREMVPRADTPGVGLGVGLMGRLSDELEITGGSRCTARAGYRAYVLGSY